MEARTRRVPSGSLPSTSASSCSSLARSRSCRRTSQSVAADAGRGLRKSLARRRWLKAYPRSADGGMLNPAGARLTRWFVGLSLLLGGLVLLGEAVAFGTLQAAPLGVVLPAGVGAAILAVFTAIEDGGGRSPMAPAAPWICSGLLGMLWAPFRPPGHAFPSGFASVG